MFAVSAMDPTIQMLFFAVAIGLFVLAALRVETSRIEFVAAGLVAFVIPFFWNALAAV